MHCGRQLLKLLLPSTAFADWCQGPDSSLPSVVAQLLVPHAHTSMPPYIGRQACTHAGRPARMQAGWRTAACAQARAGMPQRIQL
eukprot:72887-Chlamydomonas_euryale.AAC.1